MTLTYQGIAVTHPLGPELFLGIVGPIGTDLETLSNLLEETLKGVGGYRTTTIRLIELVRQLEPWKNLPSRPVHEYYHKAMDAGDEFRKQIGDGGALAVLAMRYIREVVRAKAPNGAPDKALPRQAYLFRSLKHPGEVQALRETYGSAFFLIGAYSPKATRVANLARRLAGSDVMEPTPEHRREADRLVERDESESGVSFGQAIRDAFPLADVFVDVSAPREQVRLALKRFIELILGYPFHTPTRQEYGMFHAHASALRSSAMGRQVGAALCNEEGDVLALGTNEVPKAFGGQYWGDEREDRRDFQLGIDSNDEIKHQNVTEIIERLKKAGWFAAQQGGKPPDELLAEALPILKGVRAMSPIEYGRAVHAEMSALMDAARRGVSVTRSELYSTTFPCHECARHIIVAGVRVVYFIEPYPKSLALDLHRDSVVIEDDGQSDKVAFLPFVGIAPRQYLTLFAMRARKTADGKIVAWDGQTAMPVTVGPHKSYFEAEDWLGDELKKKMATTQLTLI